VNRSHKKTVRRAVRDQRVEKCYRQQYFVAEQGYFCFVFSKQDAYQAGPELWLCAWVGKD